MKLKGTGRKGMLTKGDVLFALGKIKDARGSAAKLEVAAVEVKKDEVGRPPASLNAFFEGADFSLLVR